MAEVQEPLTITKIVNNIMDTAGASSAPVFKPFSYPNMRMNDTTAINAKLLELGNAFVRKYNVSRLFQPNFELSVASTLNYRNVLKLDNNRLASDYMFPTRWNPSIKITNNSRLLSNYGVTCGIYVDEEGAHIMAGESRRIDIDVHPARGTSELTTSSWTFTPKKTVDNQYALNYHMKFKTRVNQSAVLEYKDANNVKHYYQIYIDHTGLAELRYVFSGGIKEHNVYHDPIQLDYALKFS